jgi:lysophospholipase L1-like esterase
MRDELKFPKVPKPPSIGPKFAILGDSITEYCSGSRLPPLSSPIQIWRNDGYAAWLRILSNQRVNLPISNNYGVAGDTLAQILVRVPTIIASDVDYCVVEGGTNDITLGTSYSSMVSTWISIVTQLRDGGVIPIVTPIIPRGDAVTTEQILKQLRFNNYVQEYALANGLIFVNWNKYLLDQTSATNAPLSGMLRSDNIHPGIPGGFWMGKALADELNLILPTRETSMVHGPSDYYHATYNPTGNLLYTTTTSRGTMAGTGGTATANTGLTYVNNGLAAGWTALRGTSTSTCTETLSKEAKTISGERQVIQIAAGNDGGSDEVYNLRFSPSLTDIVEGDWFYGEATIEVSAAPTRVRSLEFYLFENRPSNAQTSIDNGSNDSLSGFLPAQTWTGTFRTEPIQRQSDTTAIQANIRARLNASGSTAGITIKVGDMAVRKIIT